MLTKKVSHSEPHFSQRARAAGSQPITQMLHLALTRPELVSLAAGFVDQETLPVEPTREAMAALLSDRKQAREALQYGNTPGYPPLREQVLARFLAADRRTAAESNLSIEQVVLTAGSNQLLHLVVEAICDPGDIVFCAAPTYFVFLGTLGSVKARALGVATDDQGLVPEALEAQLERLERLGELQRVRAVYLTSYYDNPRSITLSADRRARIVEIAKRWSRVGQIYVIEDAAYRELRYAGEDVPSMRSFDPRGDTVVVAETFSKSFAPGHRVGWGILPPALVEPVCNLKGNIDFGSPNFAQHLMTTVLTSGLFESHVKMLRASYRVKLDAMLAAADEFLAPLPGVRYGRPTGGMFVWLQLPEGVDTGPSGPLLDRALEEGVLYVPGEYCYPVEGEPVQRSTIRLSFGVQGPPNLRRGIEMLARAVRQLL